MIEATMENAEELAEIREQLGISKIKMAERLGVSYDAYKRYEYGTNKKVPKQVMHRARILAGRPPGDPDKEQNMVDALTRMVRIRKWSSATAALTADDDSEFMQDGETEIPAAFLKGGEENGEQHDLVTITGVSMNPYLDQGDRVLFFQSNNPIKNTIVMAQSPEGKMVVKVLRALQGRWILASTSERGATFLNLENWKLCGHALMIMKDKDGPNPNIVWPYGEPIRIPE